MTAELCIAGCKFNRQYDQTDDSQDMVRCCQCACWLHVQCISEKEEYVAGVWCCFDCRKMSSHIIELQSSVALLIQTVHTLRDELKSLEQKHSQELVSLKESISEENKTLMSKVSELSDIPKQTVESKSHGTLLLGSSIIRDVDETKLVATKCISISSGCIKDIHSALDKLPDSDKLGNITIVVGGNDCDQPDYDVTKLIDQYRELIESAKMRADTVTVSSVCPRNKSGTTSERIVALNTGLQTLTTDTGVHYADNDTAFYLRDGTLNEGFLLPDQVHLSPAGTNRLVKNLDLKLRQGLESAHIDHRKRQAVISPAPTPKEQPDELTHPFWKNAWQKVESRKKARSHPRDTNSQANPRQNTHPHQNPLFKAHYQSSKPTPHPPTPRQGYASIVKTHMPPKQSNHARMPPSSRNPIPSLLHIDTSPAHQASLPPHAPRPRPNPSHSDICQLCLGAGHSAVTCRGRDATCYKCNGQGHFARACPH